MANLYAGGIPAQGGFTPYAGFTSEGDALAQPTPGPSEESATKGGPGTPHGSSSEGEFLDASTYAVAGDMSENGMTVRDLNDISHDA